MRFPGTGASAVPQDKLAELAGRNEEEETGAFVYVIAWLVLPSQTRIKPG